MGTKALKPGDRRLKKNNPNAGQAAVKARAKAKDIAPDISDTVNPFEIKEDIILSKISYNAEYVSMLVAQLEKLTAGDKRQSVVIPLIICKEKKDAINLFIAARKYFKDAKSKMVFTARYYDIKNGREIHYNGARIWRVV
jgi:hypothetical protein